ncbi:AMP-binding protein [Weeksellaceae bacterium TAE3-ERU29]|nr:AMP-binding protein [Weeksellaceae bacterium TAE3-ERU29]
MILDFSNPDFKISQVEITETWQKQITDFINEYLNNDFVKAHTSGSTGVPKEIILPKKAMQQSARLTGKFLDLKKGSFALLCLPVQYIAGKMMIVRAIELGLKLICIEPKSVVKISQKVDFSALTPMQSEKSLESLVLMNKVILGGSPVSDTLENKLKNIDSIFYETYGMTETITHIALRKLNSETCFTTLDEVGISLDDRNCLKIKTPYFEQEIITNDVVEILKNNQFRWLGRVDNIINSGGIKINPEEIENILKPYINSAFVVLGKEDKLLGEKLILVIEGKEKTLNLPKNILPKNKTPKEIYFVAEFPRTQSGKVKRKEILALLK